MTTTRFQAMSTDELRVAYKAECRSRNFLAGVKETGMRAYEANRLSLHSRDARLAQMRTELRSRGVEA